MGSPWVPVWFLRGSVRPYRSLCVSIGSAWGLCGVGWSLYGVCVVTTGSVWALYGVCMGFLQGLYRASMGQSRAVTLIYYSQPLRSVPELPHTSTPLLWGRQQHLGSPVSLWDHPFCYTASEVPMRLPMSLWGP